MSKGGKRWLVIWFTVLAVMLSISFVHGQGLLKGKPFQYALYDNWRLGDHVGIGGTVTFCLQHWTPLDPDDIEEGMLLGYVVFEGIQLYNRSFEPEAVYGSVERWFWDSAGDIFFPYVATKFICKWVPKSKKFQLWGAKNQVFLAVEL